VTEALGDDSLQENSTQLAGESPAHAGTKEHGRLPAHAGAKISSETNPTVQDY